MSWDGELKKRIDEVLQRPLKVLKGSISEELLALVSATLIGVVICNNEILDEAKKDLYSCFCSYIRIEGENVEYHNKPVEGSIQIKPTLNPYIINAKLKKWFGSPEEKEG